MYCLVVFNWISFNMMLNMLIMMDIILIGIRIVGNIVSMIINGKLYMVIIGSDGKYEIKLNDGFSGVILVIVMQMGEVDYGEFELVIKDVMILLLIIKSSSIVVNLFVSDLVVLMFDSDVVNWLVKQVGVVVMNFSNVNDMMIYYVSESGLVVLFKGFVDNQSIVVYIYVMSVSGLMFDKIVL